MIILILVTLLEIIYFINMDNYSYYPHTIIEEDRNYLVTATYPKTNTKLDNDIEKFIIDEINRFKNNIINSKYLLERNELNIDYDYFYFNDRYISLVLKISNYNGKTKINNYSIVSCLYDKDKNVYLDILDLFYDLDKLFINIKKEFKDKENISIDSLDKTYIGLIDNKLVVYYISDNIYYINLGIDNNFKLNIVKSTKEEYEEIRNTANVLDPSKPTIAITFDDGPSRYTEDIINTLEKYNCNATFFVLGNKVSAYQELLKKSIKNGNEIGNHTYNHKWLSRLSKNEIIEQINRTQNILKDTVNYTPTLLRPSYGSVNDRIRKNTNLDIVLWTIDTKDWKIHNVDRIVELAIRNIEDGDIILMHDTYKRTDEALKKLIPILLDKGYQIVTVSELEEIKLIRSKL